MFYPLPERIIENFWDACVPQNNGCWNWIGATSSGYGALGYAGIPIRAHRLAYGIHFGEVPDDLDVCHKCDNPLCCNPAHLFLGTHEDNMADKSSKNRVGVSRGGKNGNAKLEEADIENIRELWRKGFNGPQIGKLYSISRQHARRIATGRNWAHTLK